MLLQTRCHDWHVAHGGRMVDFAGWEMPVQYTSIVAEHTAVRTACGLFDIAHMGRLRFIGPDAAKFLDHIVTNDVAGLEIGQIRYALVTNDQGGILDDVLVYRFADHYLLVVNASNRLKILAWIEQHRKKFQATIEDLTQSHFMLALQGPQALQLIQPLVDVKVAALRYYTGAPALIGGERGIVSRTGYTGEDGCEVIVPSATALKLWETLFERGTGVGLLPAGLGCRDTLRLEAAMPLYGHELNESIDPYTAGLAFGVKLDAKEFIGREALIAAKANPQRPRRIGLVLAGRRIAREGAALFLGETSVGQVTSGTFSPTLQKSIAMAYVRGDQATIGTELQVDIRGAREPARVVKLPFYKR
ncbi:MAG TPA: glycine cleavage system aminomethyltransferase GcvT, partial [Planctomycetaceae bacterium]|nr:glycine cleavage system aminomethyltransferase GcvT [Planctomycetaceae bacterium]